MFPNFIQVGLYLGDVYTGGGGGVEGAYNRDDNWVSYLEGVYSVGVLTGFYGISCEVT